MESQRVVGEAPLRARQTLAFTHMSIRASNFLGSMPLDARMRTVDERVVRAPVERVFEVAADVERWPALLAHYRYVRFRERMGGAGVVEMSANRPFGPLSWPTWWVSLMEVQHPSGSAQAAIRFRHIDGITTGMEVQWSFDPVTDGTHVTVLRPLSQQELSAGLQRAMQDERFWKRVGRSR